MDDDVEVSVNGSSQLFGCYVVLIQNYLGLVVVCSVDESFAKWFNF